MNSLVNFTNLLKAILPFAKDLFTGTLTEKVNAVLMMIREASKVTPSLLGDQLVQILDSLEQAGLTDVIVNFIEKYFTQPLAAVAAEDGDTDVEPTEYNEEELVQAVQEEFSAALATPPGEETTYALPNPRKILEAIRLVHELLKALGLI